MKITPICETPIEFEVVDESTGKGIGLFISVISPYAKDVATGIKNQFQMVHRMNELSEIVSDELPKTESNEIELEIHSATQRIVAWRGMEESYSRDTALVLCSTNPFIRKQVLHYSNQVGIFLDNCVHKLVDYAKNELKLSAKQKDGSSLREQLESIKRQTGLTPKELESIDMPHLIEYLWSYFLELNNTRQSGMGVSSITYSEISAWCYLCDITLSPFEVKVIKLLDSVFVEHYNKESDKESSTTK
jgi:hypothetical protein